jgi:hypothetical protein
MIYLELIFDENIIHIFMGNKYRVGTLVCQGDIDRKM